MPRARYTSASSFASTSRSGSARRACGDGRDASASSRCERTDTNSPAPIDRAPASRPAIPVSSTVAAETPDAPMPRMRARFDTRPSFAPKTAARKFPEMRRRPRVARERTTSSWMRSSAAIAAVASASASYSERDSARCTSASVNTEPKRRASQPSARLRSVRAAGLASGPSRLVQCAACRPSASAIARRISRSSPVRLWARSR